jgi:hypothetical protein
VKACATNAIPADLPPLPTLDLKPTWTNRAGRVDRSACLALCVGRLWRRIEPDGWTRLCTGNPAREAWAEIAVHAIDLISLHRRRGPHVLRGDLRTTKSHVMRGHARPLTRGKCGGERGGECGGEGAGEGGPRPRPRKRIHKSTAAPNPNFGATSAKVLGLTNDDSPFDDVHDWVQVIRMERWRYPLPPPTREQVNLLSFRADVRARLPRAQHFVICPLCGGKFRKLFTILATPPELRDARLAESWIAMSDARRQASRLPSDPGAMALRARLIDRYAPLMNGRRLVCRGCLGMRYGEVKPQWVGTRAADIDAPLRYRMRPGSMRGGAGIMAPPPDPRIEEFWQRVEAMLASDEAPR